jgi:hypothetical protein
VGLAWQIFRPSRQPVKPQPVGHRLNAPSVIPSGQLIQPLAYPPASDTLMGKDRFAAILHFLSAHC